MEYIPFFLETLLVAQVVKSLLPIMEAKGIFFNTLRTGNLNLQITLGTGDFKPTTLTCALFTLKINIKFPN
jgi:hypothetical protein